MEKIKRSVGDIWTEMQGSKKLWKVQFPKGIMTFDKKKTADKWAEQLIKNEGVLK